MKIALYHGYELTGSGSNEYNRYLAKTLKDLGHEVHIICREPNPSSIPFIDKALSWNIDGQKETLFKKKTPLLATLHQLPHGDVRPVYVTDKHRDGNVKAFSSLSDDELRSYHNLNVTLLTAILEDNTFDILHVNHLVYQPIVAMEACKKTSTPFIIFPHGSSIEYTIRTDPRYHQLAKEAIVACDGLIIGNREVTDRIISLYPELKELILDKTEIVGVGVDTALFQPISRSERKKTVQSLLNAAENLCLGKSIDQSDELINQVKEKGIQATVGQSNRYKNDYPDQEFCQKMNQIPLDANLLLFVGSLTVGKGLQTLLVALPKVLEAHPNTHLLIVGSGAYREVLEGFIYAMQTGDKALLLDFALHGKDLDRNELEGPWEDVLSFLKDPNHLESVIKQGKNLRNKVHFLGRLNHQLLPHLFPIADITVFPSIVPEAYPLVLMESFSNKVLPIVSYFSGFKDAVDSLEGEIDNRIIQLMKIPKDPNSRVASLISNLNELLEHSLSEELQNRLRNLAVEKYDWNIRAKEMVKAYKKLYNERNVKWSY